MYFVVMEYIKDNQIWYDVFKDIDQRLKFNIDEGVDFISKNPIKSIISGKITSINEKGLTVNIANNINDVRVIVGKTH